MKGEGSLSLREDVEDLSQTEMMWPLTVPCRELFGGRNVPLYVAMEIIHARLLCAMGSKAEAAQQEADAKQRLEDMRQCNGCSISAMGFR